ncbi:MAG: hypothetical protein PHD82_15315 [Candidatus Riflebacteria bacterium]|nr:hypothetical protein [Candidatus Riflebacteria bacterium]
MFEKIKVVDNHEMLLVSQRAVFVFIGFLLLMTLSLMSFFLWADFDYILGRKHLAMKVGQTSISFDDLKKIQKFSGARARKASEAAYASQLFDTLLMAEGGRRAGLDRKPEFLKKIEDFDAALKNAGDDETVIKAAFLIEELAAANRERILNLPETPGAAMPTSSPAAQPPGAGPRLHLRTILTTGPDQIPQILAMHASGSSFADLNASFSVSLYKSVGGDIGWKAENDFPEGVFTRLLALPVASLTEGFTDMAGTHLFEVVSRPEEDPAAVAGATREQLMRELKSKRLMRATIELRNQIDAWMNPVLQIKCQISPGADPADSYENR